jgi:hypothetical protein
VDNIAPFTVERIKKALMLLNFIRLLKGLEFKACRMFVPVIGLAVLSLCYGSVADADAVYSFTKTMGGPSGDFGQSVVVDSSGNVYITGSFRGTADFDPDGTGDNHLSAGEEDIFLTKINSDGSYGWTKTMGGGDRDYGQSVAVYGSDNIYITGSFRGTADFDPDGTGDNHIFTGS